jgi:hypothetical protein
MFLASVYPGAEISALSMMAIAFIMFTCLAIWLGLAFLADRQPRKQSEQSHTYTAVVAAARGKTAKDGVVGPGQPHGVAA